MVATNGDTPQQLVAEAVLKEIEKKQAILNKKKDAALATANEAANTLLALENKKQEYLNGIKLKEPLGGSFSETTLRSAVKAFMWRVIAGSVTFVTSLSILRIRDDCLVDCWF